MPQEYPAPACWDCLQAEVLQPASGSPQLEVGHRFGMAMATWGDLKRPIFTNSHSAARARLPIGGGSCLFPAFYGPCTCNLDAVAFLAGPAIHS